MAKVRVFKDRRPYANPPARHRPKPNSTEQTEAAKEDVATSPPEEEGVLQAAQPPLPQESFLAPTSIREPTEPERYPITFPGVEEIMARVHARAQQLGIQSSILPMSIPGPQYADNPDQSASLHSRPPLFQPVTVNGGNTFVQYQQQAVIRGPTEVQLRGYAGLEGLPILYHIMNHPRINSIHSFYFRFNDPENPAGVLLVDPLNPKDGDRDRYCPFINKDAIGWLYVRRHGDAMWTRDFMAPKGNGRHAVYLQRCKPGWRWEQQLGDLLDTRKSLNLWVTVKDSQRRHVGNSTCTTIL